MVALLTDLIQTVRRADHVVRGTAGSSRRGLHLTAFTPPLASE